MSRMLADRSIVITGASSGIGAATAVACAEAGMNLVLNARRADRLETVAERARTIGRRVTTVVGDVTEQDISDRMLDAAEALPGGCYAVFANAGYGLDRPMVSMDAAELRAIFDVNFFASADLLRKAAARLINAERPGHLLMCSSCLARFTMPDAGAYCATKAAQNHICRAMRMELCDRNIEVAAVMPVTTETEFFDVSVKRGGGPERVQPPAPRPFVQPPQRVARAVVRCLRRPRPEVWTSMPTRLGAAMMTAWPTLMDVVMRQAGSMRRRGSD